MRWERIRLGCCGGALAGQNDVIGPGDAFDGFGEGAETGTRGRVRSPTLSRYGD